MTETKTREARREELIFELKKSLDRLDRLGLKGPITDKLRAHLKARLHEVECSPA